MAAPGAVVIGGYVNGLGLVRALAARGIPVAVVTTRPFDVAHRSRSAVTHVPLPALHEDPDSLAELLERRAGDWAGWALFPTNDEALAALADHHDALSRTYRVVAPAPEAARALLDKDAMHAAAATAGADVPRRYGPAERATADARELLFPVVVKPLVGYRFAARFGAKLFVAHDRDDLRRCADRMAVAGIAGQVTDLVAGPDTQVYAHCLYVDAAGEPSAGVTIRKLRQSPASFGVARVAEIAADPPPLHDVSVVIARRLGLRGMAVVEFKRDARDGRFRFIEVNGRSVVYNALLRRGGLDLAGLAWSDHVEGRPEQARPNGWRGVWVNLHADLLHSVLRDRLRTSEFLAPYRRRPRIEAVWSARDPLPFLTQWARTATRPRGTSRRHGARTGSGGLAR